MKNYNRQIEAYAQSLRQGDSVRNSETERSSGERRQNRYHDDYYDMQREHRPYESGGQDRRQSVSRFDPHYRGYNDEFPTLRADQYSGGYPETYRGGMHGYMNEQFGNDRGRQDYFHREDNNRYGNRQHRGKGPRNYQRTDARIREDIMDRLTDDHYIDASNIDVEVNNGEIVLSGSVDNGQAKRRAEEIADRISGVRNVENRLRVFESAR